MPKHLNSRVIIKKPRIIYADLAKKYGQRYLMGLATGYDHTAEISIRQNDRELFLSGFHEIVGHLTHPTLTEKQVIKLERVVGVAMWKIVCKLRRKWRKEWEKEHGLL